MHCVISFRSSLDHKLSDCCVFSENHPPSHNIHVLTNFLKNFSTSLPPCPCLKLHPPVAGSRFSYWNVYLNTQSCKLPKKNRTMSFEIQVWKTATKSYPKNDLGLTFCFLLTIGTSLKRCALRPEHLLAYLDVKFEL